MRNRYFQFILFSSFIVSFVLAGCSKKAGTLGARSSKTGMKYNDPDNGGFQVNRKVKSGPGPGLVMIEGGTFLMGGSLDEDLAYENDVTKRRVTVASFYMDETEVANVDWLEYLYWLQTNYPGDRELYYRALPDTLVWRNPLSYNEPYVDNYLRHPAYQDYPVVGVTWEQAQDYCAWRTDRVNEEILRSKGVLADYKSRSVGEGKQPFNTDIYLNGQYIGEGIDGERMPKDMKVGAAEGATRPVRLEDGLLKQPYRLPTEAEWEYAALGLIGNTVRGNVQSGRVYPWNGMGVRSERRRTQGMVMANFKLGRGNNMGTAGYLNDGADITAPVRKYKPNDFGLYNMAGNVNEWVQDVYRKLSFEDFDDFNPFRGNVYENKQVSDAERGIYAQDKHGKPIKVAATTERKQTWEELQGQRTGDTTQYTNDLRGYNDDEQEALYGITSLVNNKSRVYKGGSWNDRAYWLNPATRRYMQQDQSSATVGFRCAMTLTGDPQINKKGQPKLK
ncbi:SUMF1/EgtB/PvdO family nonheme iron enzyme [Olivibacter sitiensis]|uniref:SUMF1/EgtB/PvdO family nonheme iron enzyme n=1 Tax=Olivibacter sitiensis TaxID=376470 RepID=UPI000484C4B4|nr:SUMF1/EgtB/PvdO family nonheme iron enzyme [Olivibacter sitiensis]